MSRNFCLVSSRLRCECSEALGEAWCACAVARLLLACDYMMVASALRMTSRRLRSRVLGHRAEEERLSPLQVPAGQPGPACDAFALCRLRARGARFARAARARGACSGIPNIYAQVRFARALV